MKTTCPICPRGCELEEGQTGFCRARANEAGKIVSIAYGQVTSIALDPIEKKPLNRFYSGSNILSIGSFGCNLRCPFCQNHGISMCGKGEINTRYIEPSQLIEAGIDLKTHGNIGIAYTYNEPLTNYEYVYDCSKAAHKAGLKNVLVTNGYVCERPFTELLPYIDAANIDLKGFTEEYYRELGGELKPVMKSIELAAKQCRLEVTMLIVPGKNDSEEEMRRACEWLSAIDPEIPLHISRFFPTYKLNDIRATPVKDVYNLAEVARGYLKYVYTGNC